MLIARFDGCCLPRNPKGHTACACIVKRDGVEIYRASEYVGHGEGMTNNVAEFQGMLLILKWFNALENKEPMKIIGDSNVVIRRMTGKARKEAKGVCAPQANDCLLAASWNKKWLTFEWQGRSNNDECDLLCEKEVDAYLSQ